MSPLSSPPLLALLVSLLLHELAMMYFPQWNLLDFPERYGLTRDRLPYPTGIIAVILFIVFFGFLEPNSLQRNGLIAGILLLGITCLVDDRKSINPLLRGAIQLLVTVIIFATGTYIFSLTNPLDALQIGSFDIPQVIELNIWKIGPFPLLSGLFTIIWLGMTINALNWFDGIPGQVNVLSTIAFVTIGLLSLSARVDQPHLAVISFTLGAISLGSLPYSIPVPRMLIGDTGAMFYGLMIGVLTIYAGGKVATAFIVLGVPLIDSMIVVARRLKKGSSILKGNAKDEHLHHRLLTKGWSNGKILLLTAALGSAFGITALFLNTWQKFVAAIILFAIMLWLHWYSRPQNV